MGSQQVKNKRKHLSIPCAAGLTLEDLKSWRAEMLNPDTLKHFKLFRDPFLDEVRSENDIYYSDEHKYIKQVMLEAARHGGLLAVVGEVGSGKSVMRKAAIEEMKREGNIQIVSPQMFDKTRLNAGSICDAIILDISTETPKIKLEAKSRQVKKLLLDRSKNHQRHVLIIEEAHDLNVKTLKYLKRFWEMEDGFRKLLGIILVGQLELLDCLDEQRAHEAREVIRRCQIAHLRSLDGQLEAYLQFKFGRINKNMAEIISDDGVKALSNRMTVTDRDRKKVMSHIYPLTINNLVIKAMNLAADLGERIITAEVVEQI